MKREIIVVLVGLSFALPLLSLISSYSSYLLHILIIGFYYIILASSWNLLAGYSGQFSFSHAAFAGMGAYASALFVAAVLPNPWIGIGVGSIAVTAASLLLGIVCIRMRGHYLALATIAFSEIIRLIVLNEVKYTGGAAGFRTIPLFETASRVPSYYAMLLSALAVLYFIYRLVNSNLGLFIRAIREDEEAASSLGVNVRGYRILAFVISGTIAGLAGGLYGHYVMILDPRLLSIDEMALVLTMTIIGGIGTIQGPVMGALLVYVFSEYVRGSLGEYHLLILGLAVILVLRFARGGIVDALTKLSGTLRTSGFILDTERTSRPQKKT